VFVKALNFIGIKPFSIILNATLKFFILMTITLFHNEECEKHSNTPWPYALSLGLIGALNGSIGHMVLAIALNEYFVADRKHRTRNFLNRYSLDDNYKFRMAEKATEEDILRFHSKSLLRKVKQPSIKGLLNGICEINEQTYNSAIASAGVAISASNASIEGTSDLYFGLCRPPGHHATRDSPKGYCYFNNMNIAIMKLLHRGKIDNALIIDFDAHIGNGIQDLVDVEERIEYIDYGVQMFRKATDHVDGLSDILSEKCCSKYDLVGICAGFDAHKGHPLIRLNNKYSISDGLMNGLVTMGQNRLDDKNYFEIGRLLKQFNSEVSKNKLFAILEGGYHPRLYRTIDIFCKAFQN